jgi:L-lactate dehydrogenase complex protein LldG
VGRARDLNGTDVGVIRGCIGVAENACVWIPQQMKEKAVCFISENLVILLDKKQIVNNMHEAYARLSKREGCGADQFNEYGYGSFISGPSKTADIAQVLVMGAQAARSATVLLLDE